MKIDVHHFFHFESAQLNRIEAAVTAINTRGIRMEQVTQDTLDAVKEIGDAVDQLPAIIDGFEARITQIIANSQGMPQADKDALTQAVADLKGKAQKVRDTIADAADGIDEAASGTAPAGTPGTPPA